MGRIKSISFVQFIIIFTVKSSKNVPFLVKFLQDAVDDTVN